MRYALFAAGYLAAYVVLAWAATRVPALQTAQTWVVFVIPPAIVLAALVRLRRRYAGCQRLFWDVFAIAALVWVGGQLGWMLDRALSAEPAWLRWHTLFVLCGAAPVIALVARPDRGARVSSTSHVAILVAATGLFVVFLYSFFVFIPSLRPDGSRISLTHLLLLNGAALTVVAAGQMVSAGESPWRRVYGLLAATGAASVVFRLGDSYAPLAGVMPQGTLFYLAWLVPFLLALVAVGESPASAPRVEAVEHPGPPPIAIAVPALAVPLIGYGSLVLLPLGAPDSAVRELVTTLMTIGGLGLLTLRLYAQGGELQRADARARLLGMAVERIGDAVLITRADGGYEHANDAFLRAGGYTRDELAALSPAELTARGLTLVAGPVLDEIREHGRWRGTTVRKRRDGAPFHAACTIVGLRNADGRLSHFVAVERDLTDELRLREQLVHAERLSAMGALIAGIAHEINNPLQTILGSAELLMEEQPESGRRELDLVRREAARAAQIVRSLLSFVRRATPDRAEMDLSAIVRATVDLREYHLTRSNITLDVALHPEPLPVMVNREEIQQVVLNLVLNAEQALEPLRGGTIAVRTFPRGGTQVVEVADSGSGITADLRGRVFEPFFTTKDVGAGTGLGLSISHGIAQAHGGALELCPGPLAGACFQLSLPAYFARPGERSPAGTGPAAPGVVLVVDDEAPIRLLLRRLLERRGFDVIEAESGDAAVAAARDRAIALVICAVRMPRTSGLDVHQRLTAIEPALGDRFVFVSGDAQETVDGAPILRKPFTSADLDAILEQTRL